MDTSTINFYKGNHKYEVSADELATEIAQCPTDRKPKFLDWGRLLELSR